MKKITTRAFSVLLIAALVMFGMGVYLARYIEHGSEWALYFSRANSGSSGALLDRNGVTLAYFDALQSSFSSDEETRMANYHVTGDYWGRTGTGILSRYWQDLQEFSLITGTTKGESSTLKLNIDSQLDRKIYRVLMGNGPDTRGCMMVCNYRTGELLGMVSVPSVDPLYAQSEVRDGAYINRCLSATYTPGSIFKLVTAAAAIENIPDIDSRSFYCEKEHDIAGVTITCSGTHYTQDFRQALSNSCNVAFSQIAVSLGQDTMIEYVTGYGLNKSHELNGISCYAGSYPTEFIGDPELGWSGIGQSTVMVCPYAMLRFVCAIANGGIIVEPQIISGGEASSGRLITRSTAEKLSDMMAFNVRDHYGQENFPDLDICAKTGTAELGDGTSHAWFVGFLRDEAHPYAFVTLVEQGGYGLTVAGSVTNQVMQWAVKNMNDIISLPQEDRSAAA